MSSCVAHGDFVDWRGNQYLRGPGSDIASHCTALHWRREFYIELCAGAAFFALWKPVSRGFL